MNANKKNNYKLDPIISKDRQEFKAANIPIGIRHDLLGKTSQRNELLSSRIDPKTIKVYLKSPSMPFNKAQRLLP